jgi:preprotein translocase subunit SecE
MPSLTGFTIAAFAIIFAILDEKMLHALTISDDFGGSPMAKIAAAIGHAVLIQVTALILAIAFKTVNLEEFIELTASEMNKICWPSSTFLVSANWIKNIGSALGLFCTYYGVMLVLAAVLSIFRMQLIVANAKKSKKSQDQS